MLSLNSAAALSFNAPVAPVVRSRVSAPSMLEIEFGQVPWSGSSEISTKAGMEAIAGLVRDGTLGEIFAVDLTFHNAYGPDKPWFYDPAQSGGGCVVDLGVRDLREAERPERERSVGGVIREAAAHVCKLLAVEGDAQRLGRDVQPCARAQRRFSQLPLPVGVLRRRDAARADDVPPAVGGPELVEHVEGRHEGHEADAAAAGRLITAERRVEATAVQSHPQRHPFLRDDRRVDVVAQRPRRGDAPAEVELPSDGRPIVLRHQPQPQPDSDARRAHRTDRRRARQLAVAPAPPTHRRDARGAGVGLKLVAVHLAVELAVQLMQNLSLHDAGALGIERAGALPVLVAALRADEALMRAQGLTLLVSLAERTEMVRPLIKAGVIKLICFLGKGAGRSSHWSLLLELTDYLLQNPLAVPARQQQMLRSGCVDVSSDRWPPFVIAVPSRCP